MQDRPTAAELLATVATYLEEELMPTLDGPLGYRTRVAVNLLRTLEREESLGAASLLRERDALVTLLGGGPPLDGTLYAQVAELNRRVTRAIDGGELEHERAWSVLMEIARAKLAIIRPGYDDYDARGELP
jgi:Domain of unknown function (DUF6285)